MGSAFERLGYTEDDTTIAPTPTAVQQPVVTPQASAYANLTGTQDEEAVEQGMELILGGLPDNGRILRDRNTKQLHFVSQGYSTSNQDEIKRIIDEGKQGEVVDLGAEAESKFQRDILGQLPESGLLAQQFFSGGVGGGSWMLAKKLQITEEEAQEFLDAKSDAFPGIDVWKVERGAEIQKQGFAATLMGARKHITKLFGHPKIKYRF